MSYKTEFQQYKNKRVLVTGGLGFIGSNLAITLVKLGARVTIVDSMIDAYGGNLFNIRPIAKKVHVNFSDIRDQYGLTYLVQHQDKIFNLAGQVSHIDSMTDPYTDLEINCASQLSLLETIRKYNPKVKVIYSSTRQIYGKPQYLPVDEQHPVLPTDINGINKAAGEWYHTMYHNVHGLKTVALRLTNTFGPRQLMQHNRQGFIPWFIRQLIEGARIEIFGDGQQIRDLNYVDDAVNALLLAGIKPNAVGNVYNLGGEPISLVDLTKLMVRVNGAGSYRLRPFPDEKKKIDIGSFYGNYDRIRTDLGWEPQTTLENALRKTFAFYKKYKTQYW